MPAVRGGDCDGGGGGRELGIESSPARRDAIVYDATPRDETFEQSNMPNQLEKLSLDCCPHCSVDKPNLNKSWTGSTRAYAAQPSDPARQWAVYACASCGGMVLTESKSGDNSEVVAWYPKSASVDQNMPPRVREYLNQAVRSVHAPAGSVMLAASAVDAMLKEKGLIKESLYDRIDKAEKEHLITPEMAKWAHEVRLDANDQRHADTHAALPTEADARNSVDFAQALAEFLFVLPARVKRGRTAEEPAQA